MEASQVPIRISAFNGQVKYENDQTIIKDSDTDDKDDDNDDSGDTNDNIELTIGSDFTSQVYKSCQSSSLDPFGENGEFHSCAVVWEQSNINQALGIIE